MTVDRHTALGDLPELMRVHEIAAWADVSPGVVYEAIRAGDLPSVRFGRVVRVPRSAIEAWLTPKRQEVRRVS